MTGAAQLVAQAKEWATYYGKFTSGEEAAVLGVPLKVRAAWDSNDADALASVFVDNGSWLAGDKQLTGRDEIRAYMAEVFAGPLQGSKVTEEPLEIKVVNEELALAITDGGVLYEGETELPPGRKFRTMWVIVKQDGDWKLASHQTSPVKG